MNVSTSWIPRRSFPLSLYLSQHSLHGDRLLSVDRSFERKVSQSPGPPALGQYIHALQLKYEESLYAVFGREDGTRWGARPPIRPHMELKGPIILMIAAATGPSQLVTGHTQQPSLSHHHNLFVTMR